MYSRETVDVSIARLQERMDSIEKKVDSIDKKMDTLLEHIDNSFVRKEEFNFWRNLLVSGILLAIAIGFFLNLIKK